MNNSKKPRQGSTARITQRLRYPKGYGKKSGAFISAENLNLVLSEIKARNEAARRSRGVEVKRTQRARHAALMAKPDGVTNRSELRDEMNAFGSTNASHLRENTVYKWHGVFRIEGGAGVVEKILRMAGSDTKIQKLTGTADTTYEMIITPFFGRYTPAIADERLPDHAEEELAKYQRTGATVAYLGAFYRK